LVEFTGVQGHKEVDSLQMWGLEKELGNFRKVTTYVNQED